MRGAFLFIEHLAIDPVRKSAKGERPTLKVGKDARCDRLIVPKDVSFREASLGIHDFREVREAKDLAVNSGVSISFHSA